MKWVCGLNEGATHFDAFVEMLCVAIHTAKRAGGLEPHLLYSGEPNAGIERLQKLGFTLIPTRTFVYDQLRALGAAENYPEAWIHGDGVYLRLELPLLAERLGWPDEHLLYTDCDVMFLPPFNVQTLPRPARFFAVAAEAKDGPLHDFNSGVMVMHLPSLREVDADLRAFVQADLPQAVRHDWDQYSLRRFFRDRIEPALAPEWNWRPYWGPNPAARVIHFHGPKPFVRRYLQADCAPAAFVSLATDHYWAMCEQWDAELRASLASIGE